MKQWGSGDLHAHQRSYTAVAPSRAAPPTSSALKTGTADVGGEPAAPDLHATLRVAQPAQHLLQHLSDAAQLVQWTKTWGGGASRLTCSPHALLGGAAGGLPLPLLATAPIPSQFAKSKQFVPRCCLFFCGRWSEPTACSCHGNLIDRANGRLFFSLQDAFPCAEARQAEGPRHQSSGQGLCGDYSQEDAL